MTLINRIKENNPDYNPQDRLRSDELIIKKLRKLYEVSQEEYTLKEITRDATILAGFTFVAGTCVMYPTEVKTILNYIFG